MKLKRLFALILSFAFLICSIPASATAAGVNIELSLENANAFELPDIVDSVEAKENILNIETTISNQNLKNESTIEWIKDRYKESNQKIKTIIAKIIKDKKAEYFFPDII